MVLQLRSLLMLGSAAVIFTAGVLHLVYTFSGSRLQPRDAEFHARMQEVSPVITRRTTMWKVWVGLNASHSFGLILFAAVYGYLALRHAPFLFASIFLLALGVSLLSGYAVLSWVYWFRGPLRLVLLAALLYALSLAVHWRALAR
jgi:hypothetical protein